MKKAIYWFRNDLRLHDQGQLKQIVQQVDELLPFYCFDTRFYSIHPLGFPRTTSFRTQFLAELYDPQQRYQNHWLPSQN
jgi:deoxyribodipyrimidine photo-lyase